MGSNNNYNNDYSITANDTTISNNDNANNSSDTTSNEKQALLKMIN